MVQVHIGGAVAFACVCAACGSSSQTETGGRGAPDPRPNNDSGPATTIDAGAVSAPGVDDPPNFAGVERLRPEGLSSLVAEWSEARDDNSAPEAIVYSVFVSNEPGMQDFTAPTLRSPAGSTSMRLSGLPLGLPLYVVVRATDEAGNENENRVELSAIPDGRRPQFAGIVATHVGATSAELSWAPASDDRSSPERIRYTVYESREVTTNFVVVRTTSPGETQVQLTDLAPSSGYSWRVRAVDEAGNEDTNEKSLSATTLVSYAINVQPIYDANCVDSCHGGSTPAGNGLSLEAGLSYAHTVGQPGLASPGTIRVDPTTSDPMASLLVRKIVPALAPGDLGSPMPPAPLPRVTMNDRDTIIQWVEQGALNN